MSGSRGPYPDAGVLLVAGIDGKLEAALEDILVLEHRLDLVLAAPPVERFCEKSEWLHGIDGYLLGPIERGGRHEWPPRL